jgi:hypothetical protein
MSTVRTIGPVKISFSPPLAPGATQATFWQLGGAQPQNFTFTVTAIPTAQNKFLSVDRTWVDTTFTDVDGHLTSNPGLPCRDQEYRRRRCQGLQRLRQCRRALDDRQPRIANLHRRTQMATYDTEKARWVSKRANELVTKAEMIRDKSLALRDAVIAVTDEDITAEAIDVRTPRSADVKTKPPGDSDTTDPWIVKDGTADWDINDGIH